MELIPLNQPIIKHIVKHYHKLLIKLSCCDLCHQQANALPLLCRYCLHDLPLFHYQKIHNDLLQWPAVARLIPKRSFDHLVCVAPYQFPFDNWLLQLKFNHRFELSKLLANLLVMMNKRTHTVIQDTTLLVVPSHISTWRKRGYNQSHLIARYFAKIVKCQYLPHAISRVRQHASQVGYSGSQRRRLMAKDFTINQEVTFPKHVILFDDVVTTGTTVNIISQLLKQHGVEAITVMAIALSLPNA
ncbi:ComF family protein [Thalassotalea sediminis]|uniref:ComF family protein n=1 Tax=Thalassotalea sediminis TaxID=1759089 RepID=UPI0025734333|nr:ComF family protein [Thalassotalea sediminis]